MEFSPGAIALDDIIGGTLQVGEVPNARLETNLTALADVLLATGIVPISRFFPEEHTAENAGVVTVTGPGITIVADTLSTLYVGDRLLIFVHLDMTKGITAGPSQARLHQIGGTGTVLFTRDQPDVFMNDDYHLAGAEFHGALCVIGLVTVEGAPQIRVFGNSWGSDSTVFAGEAQMNIRVLRA